MRLPAVRPAAALALASILLLAACGSVPPSTAPTTGASPAASSPPEPTLTPVPGGATGAIEPVPTRVPTVQAEWGEILAVLPADFPVYPGATPVDLPEVATATLSTEADSETVAAWYTDELAARGYAVDASELLEDGGRVLDVRADLPECRIQVDFRPTGDSTIIVVLYGAGCAAAGS
jgi:hypothetical protein